MKALYEAVKVISFKDAKFSRRITINVIKKVAGGMEAAGDVFSMDGKKTGFYRFNSRYPFPIFFGKGGNRISGSSPVNKAIKEVVHEWAASVNAKRKEAKTLQYDRSREKEAAIREAIKEEVKASRPAPMPEKVNINEEEEDILASLPGISLPLADRIVEYRENEGSFQSPEELMKIKGIGQAKYEKLRGMIRV